MMATSDDIAANQHFISKATFADLLQLLIELGYHVVGPVIEQEAITYGTITSIEDLPRGWTDEQEPGKYRLKQRDDDQFFGYVVGPHSWKQFLFPSGSKLSEADKTPDGWQFRTAEESPPKFAFLGVRACELAAMKVQDRVFLNDAYVDPIYQPRREQALIIAVNCTGAASTCFCTSMNTGPRCKSGFDIALTELTDGFVVEIGSQKGFEVFDSLTLRVATTEEDQAAEKARQNAVDQIEKQLDTTGIKELLFSNLVHPRWDDVAQRCLSCTNCTMVCPTCFCSSVTEVTDLTGEHVERHRQWDSCFSPDFSYIVGGNVRDNIHSRYRQWLTHKLGSWIDQFGSSGCVGCGRCITWCPVGIDLTEEVAAIRKDPQ
jgi:ferredoxin